jgi:ring-1,2-phenylacetyl-CoA epoxidase subunit PaaD
MPNSSPHSPNIRGVQPDPSAAVFEILTGIVDPEIPVLNIVELGIIRGVESHGDTVTVRITPTYSGCPAMYAIEEEIARRLRMIGYETVNVERVFGEAWTTDWMGAEAREKLRQYGIAPPQPRAGDGGSSAAVTAAAQPRAAVPCPKCGSRRTDLRSYFGTTACKSVHFCNECAEPFEAFKCI